MRDALRALPAMRRGWALFFAWMSVLCMLFIWSNSLDSREQSLAKSSLAESLVRPVLLALPVPQWHTDEAITHITRKLAHFGEFFLLGALLMALVWSMRPAMRVAWPWLLAICLAVAAADELLQSLSDRAPMLQDVLLDVAGAAAGLGFVAALEAAFGGGEGRHA